jgi:molybdopterin/thiamine biosynthesis adenylyltransferase
MYEKMISRNLGVLSEEEQEIINNSSIGIAGVGGIGGLLAERLVRIGIGYIKITDPGAFELSNLNRQYGSSIDTIDRQKAEIIANELQKINPKCKIIWDCSGITDLDSANAFAKDISIIIDEMDYGLFKENILLQKAARENGKHYIFSTALGFGGLVVIFSPQGITLEDYNGFVSHNSIGTVDNLSIDSNRLSPHFPTYMKGKEQLVQNMMEGKAPVSSNAIGAGLAAMITANEVVNLLLKKTQICEAPRSIYIDLMDKILMV